MSVIAPEFRLGDLLRTIATATAEVNSKIADRVFPITVPQGVEFPYITYQLTNQTPTNNIKADVFFDEIAFEVKVWHDARNIDEIGTISHALRAALVLAEPTQGEAPIRLESANYEDSAPVDGSDRQKIAKVMYFTTRWYTAIT